MSDEYWPDADNQGEIDIFGTIEKSTDAAILLNDGTLSAWVPRSLISIEDEDADGATTVTMPEWLATEKGFE